MLLARHGSPNITVDVSTDQVIFGGDESSVATQGFRPGEAYDIIPAPGSIKDAAGNEIESGGAVTLSTQPVIRLTRLDASHPGSAADRTFSPRRWNAAVTVNSTGSVFFFGGRNGSNIDGKGPSALLNDMWESATYRP